MALVPENTSFALLRHMTGSRKHLAIMVVLMVAAMGACGDDDVHALAGHSAKSKPK